MVEFYLLTFPRFPLRNKEHIFELTSYLLDHSGDERTPWIKRKHQLPRLFLATSTNCTSTQSAKPKQTYGIMEQLSTYLIHRGHVGRFCQLPSVRELPSVICFCNTSKCRSRIRPHLKVGKLGDIFQRLKRQRYPLPLQTTQHSIVYGTHTRGHALQYVSLKLYTSVPAPEVLMLQAPRFGSPFLSTAARRPSGLVGNLHTC